MRYSSHWRVTVMAAILLHVMALAGIAYVLPQSEPKAVSVGEMEWLEVELEPVRSAEEPLPESVEPLAEEMDSPAPAEVSIAQEETAAAVEQPERAMESAKRQMERAEQEQRVSETGRPDQAVPHSPGQEMGQPPVTLAEAYPPSGGIPYEGRVSVVATIGVDGKVRRTTVMISSGRILIDNIAMTAASKWTFRPAMDREGKPMECDKVITFDFRELK